MGDNQQSRFEKSLGLLTTRFVTLLQKAKDGVLDLKVVSIIAIQIILKKFILLNFLRQLIFWQ